MTVSGYIKIPRTPEHIKRRDTCLAQMALANLCIVQGRYKHAAKALARAAYWARTADRAQRYGGGS